MDIAAVAPLQVIPADVGAEIVQGAPVQGAPAPADFEIEGVAYKVIDGEHDDNGTTEDEVAEAPHYNLRQQQPPTFKSYANHVDLESSSFDLSINIDDTPSNEEANVCKSFYQSTNPYHINLIKVLVAERPWERTFEKGDKPKDMDEVRNMSYQFMVTQMMEHEGIAKHGEKAVEALMKENNQLDKFKVFEPLDAACIKEKTRALRVINLLKEKRDNSVKGRISIDGRLQLAYTSKEESPPPHLL